jgi:hypothetical protein
LICRLLKLWQPDSYRNSLPECQYSYDSLSRGGKPIMKRHWIAGLLAVIGLLALPSSRPACGQNKFPYGHVKSWSGELTIEISEKSDESAMTYKATGKLELTDEMMPDGSHFQWPQVNVANILAKPQKTMMDSKAIEDANKRWPATISYQKVVNFKDAVSSANYTCSANLTQPTAVQLVAGMGMPEFKLIAEILKLDKVHCVGTRDGARYDVYEEFRPPKTAATTVTGPIKTAGPISGTKELTENGQKIRFTYSLIPGNAR